MSPWLGFKRVGIFILHGLRNTIKPGLSGHSSWQPYHERGFGGIDNSRLEVPRVSCLGALVLYGRCDKFPQILWLKTPHIYHLIVPVAEVQNGSPELKSRCQQGRVSSRGSRGEAISLPFLASRDHLHSLACGGLTLTSSSVVTFPPLPMIPLPPSYKELVMAWGHLDDPGSSPISRCLTKSHLQRPLGQVGSVRTRRFWVLGIFVACSEPALV